MKRKTLAVSLSAILAASMLFGCGSNSKSGDTKSSSGNGSASASASDASNASISERCGLFVGKQKRRKS